MLLVTTDYISGKEIKMLGMVKGVAVQKIESAFGGGQQQGLKSLNAKQEKKKPDDPVNDARNEASIKMVKDAQKLGADAIVNIRYTAAAVPGDSYEVMMYGTAVKYLN